LREEPNHVDATTITFLGIGGFALVLLLLSVIGGHDIHIGHIDLGAGHGGGGHAGGSTGGGADGTGFQLTLPAIAGFIGAFGFGGAIVAALSPWHGTGTVLLSTLAGLVAGIPMAWLSGRLMLAAMRMPTDATPTSLDLIGATGVVVTPVPADGYGEVRVTVAGQPMKLNARASAPLPLGTHIFVIEVPSPTSVLVEPHSLPLAAPGAPVAEIQSGLDNGPIEQREA
jgi:membrane protein implicated in regulation of membrane protease activity